MDILERREAKARGLTRYFTGRPCKHGHIAERDTINGSCVECDWKKSHIEESRRYAREYQRKHYRGKRRKQILARSRVPDDLLKHCRPSPHRHHKLWPKFQNQRFQALNRNILWHLTFPQWLQIWKRSGKLARRGRGVGKYVMARKKNDQGVYTAKNVSIIPWEKNETDNHKNTRYLSEKFWKRLKHDAKFCTAFHKWLTKWNRK